MIYLKHCALFSKFGIFGRKSNLHKIGSFGKFSSAFVHWYLFFPSLLHLFLSFFSSSTCTPNLLSVSFYLSFFPSLCKNIVFLFTLKSKLRNHYSNSSFTNLTLSVILYVLQSYEIISNSKSLVSNSKSKSKPVYYRFTGGSYTPLLMTENLFCLPVMMMSEYLGLN